MSKLQPYLLIFLGPTGSGKSSLPYKIDNYLKLNGFLTNPKYTTNILIDDLVELNPFYRTKIGNIIQECMKNKKCYDIFENPSKEDLEKFSKIYFLARKNVPCNENIKKNCDDLNDANFEMALKNKKNVIFESVGDYFPSWIFTVYEKFLKNYKIIMIWSVVEYCELINRNKTRAIKSLNEFISTEGKSSVPRLPNIEHNFFKNSILRIEKTFRDIIENCIFNHNKNFCKIDDIRVIVINNNVYKIDVMYDSNNKNINRSIPFKVLGYNPKKCNNINGGRKKKRYKKIKR
jgi:hypothetical protein